MIAFIGAVFDRFGASPLARTAARVLSLLILFCLIVAAAALLIRHHNATVIARHETALDQRAAPASVRAADQRAADAVTINQEERAYHDAIDNSGNDGAPDPAAVALGCERLRRAGVTLPAACGSASGR